MSFYSLSEARIRVQSLVETMFQEKGFKSEVAPRASLADIGFASMDMVNLMLGIEAAFDFTIPNAEITPETFRTIDTIASMVVRHLPQAVAA